MKKQTIVLICCMLSAIAFGQTATLSNSCCQPGSIVAVALNVTDWHDIQAITLHIEYDPNAMVFAWADASRAFPEMIIHENGGIIGMSWAELDKRTIVAGKLAVFYFLPTAASEVNFIPICEVIKMPGYVPVDVTYTNGSVTIPPQRSELVH